MVIRQLEQKQFDRLYQNLLDHAWVQPLDPTFTVALSMDGQEYAVKLQPEEDSQIAVLQALRVYREEDGPNFDLVLESNTLARLLTVYMDHTMGDS